MTRSPQQAASDATQYLIDSAHPLGAAKAELVKREAMLRVVKSHMMKASGERSVSAQEREAYASPEYKAALEKMSEAAGEYEKLRAGRDAATAQIDYWRSLNANQRAAERGYGSAQ